MSGTTLHTKNPLLGAGILLIVAVFWSFFGVLVRLLGYTIPFFFGAFTRNILAAILMGVALVYFKQYKAMTRADWWWVVARSSVGMVSMIGGFAGFYYLPLGTAYFMNFGGTVVGSFLLGKLLFQEKVTSLKWLSLGLAFLGMGLVYQVSFNPQLTQYMVLTMAAGLAGSFWTVGIKKISHAYSALQLNALDAGIFSVLALGISLFKQEPWQWPTPTLPWLANLCFLVMLIVTGQLIIVGFKHIDAQRGSLILLLEIVLGSLLGLWFFGEQLGTLAYLGGALIITAAALPEIWELRRAARSTHALDQ